MAYNQYPPYGQPPPQGYGAPPPHHGQYGYQQHPPPPGPPAQYGYQQPPPPPGQYGYQQPPPPPPPQGSYYGSPAPPQQPYGAPTPPQPYGAHSLQPGYGPPPSSQYGAPPAHGYGAPPPQQYGAGLPTYPSPGYGPPEIIQWNAGPDARALHTAMKGLLPDKTTLINVLSRLDPHQIESLKKEYFMQEQQYSNLSSLGKLSKLGQLGQSGKKPENLLVEHIKSKTTGDLEDGLVALVRGPLLHDCYLLHDAMQGWGTKEEVLNDVLLSRSNADIKAIQHMYHQKIGRSLESDVKGDLSLKTEKHFLMVLGANRAEDSAPVIPSQVNTDVQDLYSAMKVKLNTDELLVCKILSTRNDNQIRAIAHSYKERYNTDLRDVIIKKFSGHMEQALLYQLDQAVDKYMHQAILLEDAMKGAGTRDKLLISRVVRNHWDRQHMANIRGAYRTKYHKDLGSRIKGETSGSYRDLMLACVG